jgi:hypothetical protein
MPGLDNETGLESQIGNTAGPYEDVAGPERVTAFARAVGAGDVGALPPTFVTIFRKGEFELFSKLGFELKQVLHAEQDYVYGTPMRPGDLLSYESKLVQVVKKGRPGKSLTFITIETRIVVGKWSPDATPAVVSRTLVVLREGGRE